MIEGLTPNEYEVTRRAHGAPSDGQVAPAEEKVDVTGMERDEGVPEPAHGIQWFVAALAVVQEETLAPAAPRVSAGPVHHAKVPESPRRFPTSLGDPRAVHAILNGPHIPSPQRARRIAVKGLEEGLPRHLFHEAGEAEAYAAIKAVVEGRRVDGMARLQSTAQGRS